MKQQTLTEETVEPVECVYYDGCHNQVAWEIEAHVYDGCGWVYKDIVACESCHDEHFEVETRVVEEDSRELQACERWG